MDLNLKDFECIEYFLDSNNNITGHQLWPLKKRPEFASNPAPLDAMIKDGYFDEYKRPKWKLINFEFVENVYGPPNDNVLAQKILSTFTVIDFAQRLSAGIEDKKDPQYLELKKLLEDLGG